MARNTPMVQQKKFSTMISTPSYQAMIANTLRDPNRQRRFVAAITSAVAATPALQSCNPSSILAGALLGEGLNLSPSPQLGQFYLVPFKCKAKDARGNQLKDQNGEDLYENKAQFVLGYKGYVQMALKSKQYVDMDAVVVKEGEYLGRDPSTGKPMFTFLSDDEEWQRRPTAGYMAYLEYDGGFRKTVYWSKEKMMAHADRFSPAFSAQALKRLEAGEIPDRDLWRYSSFWYKDFDGMACKTMLRQLISKWGILSTEMQAAITQDGQFADCDLKKQDVVVHDVDVVSDAPEEAMDELDPIVEDGEITLDDL